MELNPIQFQFSLPGKVFLLGEYLALKNGPSILATVPPRFQFLIGKGKPVREIFHPESPAGKFLSIQDSQKELNVQFIDPYEEQGGFGASTAQFLFVYSLYQTKEIEWKDALSTYIELFESNHPSGADLVAQIEGGVIQYEPEEQKVFNLDQKFDWNGLLVFSAAHQVKRKVATHEHLKLLDLPDSFTHSLKIVVENGIQAIEDVNPSGLGKCLDEYAQLLNSEGLECEATREDRKALRQLDGVLGVKGSGALQADVIVILTSVYGSKGLDQKKRIIKTAEERGLRLIADGLEIQSGLTRDIHEMY